MTRLEKIVLEQKIRKGNMGVRKIDGPLSSRTAKYFTNVDDLVTSFYYVDKHGKQGKGKKYTPLTSNELVQRWLPTLFELQKYNTKDYIVILDTDSQVTDKTESVWDVFVVNRNSISKIPDSDIKKLGNVGSAPLISLIEFQRLKKQVELVALATKEKADAEAASELEKKKPAIEKTKVVVQNVVKGTSTINPNNLGKGTEDAKAFQELMWQAGNKLNFTDEPAKTDFKNFAYYRTKGPDGGWDGAIGTKTKDALYQFVSGNDENLYDMWAAGKKAEVIEELRLTAAATVSESINYFKGKGMNVKLKDLLQEQLLKEQAKKAVGGTRRGGSSGAGGGGNTPKPSSTNFTPKSFPGNYTGSGTITYDNDNTFTGSWKNGKKSGQGTYKLTTGKKYDGTWSNGKMNGIFTITYSNGDIRVGTFNSAGLSGPVTFTKKGEKPVEETWKDSKLLPSNAKYWTIAKDWVEAEYEFWKENGGSGPEGQIRTKTREEMFKQYNYTWDDDESGAKKAYLANRKHALQWLKDKLVGSVEVTGEDYYTQIETWINKIASEITDTFQNDVTILLSNDGEGDTITRTVQSEIDT